MLNIKFNKLIFLKVIIFLILKPSLIFAETQEKPREAKKQASSRSSQTYLPPRMGDQQQPQRATLSGSRGSCLDYSDSFIPLFPQAKNILTALTNPVFLFQLKSPLSNPAYFSLVSNDKIEPIYEQKIENAGKGLLAFKVPEHIELKPNQTYRLNFIIVCNEKRPSHNWSVSTLVTRVENYPVSLSTLSKTSPVTEQALLLSQSGLWFDALELIYQKNLVDESSFSSLLENYQ